MNVSPVFVLAPGAGAPCSSPAMMAWRKRLAAIGPVHTFDYDYQCEGRRRPDAHRVLLARHLEQLASAQAQHPNRPVVLAGRSMGGRIGCHASLVASVHALVCFGYPLLAAGNPDRRRDAVLRELHTPILFVQGTRDRLCPLDALEDVRAVMTTRHALHVVPTGDHGLTITKTHTKQTGHTQEHAFDAVIDAIRAFL